MSNIEYTTQSIFDTGAQALVCPVNCVGVMGAGLALEFKKRYPKLHEQYAWVCKNCDFRPGSIYMYLDLEVYTKDIVICAATKDHWRDPSKLEWVEKCLKSVSEDMSMAWSHPEHKPSSLALPALGCGLGGLKWGGVRPLIEKYLGDIEGCRVIVCEPRGEGR